jgi:hypothetical protein
MKLFFFVFLLCILISCGDNGTVNNPDNNVSKPTFPIDTGYYWNYKSIEGREIQLKVVSFDSVRWNMKYWDTSKTVNLKSYLIEGKFIESGFPKYQNFVVSKTDSGYLLGMQGFKFTYNDEVPYFVKMFFIPDSITQQTQYNYLSLGTFYYADSTIISKSNNIMIDNELADFWIINNYFISDYQQRKFVMYDFIFADKFGFYKFMNCDLTDFKIKN